MAEYLIFDQDGDSLKASGRHITEAVEQLPEEFVKGETLTVYRVAGPPRTVKVVTETTTRLDIK